VSIARVRVLALLASSMATTLNAQPSHGVHPAAGVDEFVARARKATQRFADLSVAVTEGYVKVGPEFPAMGEHWVNGELVMRGELDAARPPILTYATIQDTRVLTGVVYTVQLKPGEAAPAAFPGAHWHDHVGSIDEESLLFGHEGMAATDGLRLVVMHAWIWTENPSGMFTTDNWALPFRRLGSASPADVPVDMGRAVSLLNGGASYYRRLFAAAGQLDERAAARVDAIVTERSQRLEAWWRGRTPGPLTPTEAAMLSQAWRDLQASVVAAVPREAGERLKGALAH
jgi:hypothetical protein